jgi:hypothetical protein
MLQLGQFARGPDAHHGAPCIELAVERFDGFAGLRLGERDVNGGKNSARQWQQVRGEHDAVFGQAGVLENFRCVAMGE